MKALQPLLGFNAACLWRLVRAGPQQFWRACRESFIAASGEGSPYRTGIPRIPLGDILGERRPVIRLPMVPYEDGMLPGEQAMALLAILVAERPEEVLEIGTYMGHTARLMAENLENAIIHTVDLPETFSAATDPERRLAKDDFHLIERRRVGREFKGQPCAARIRQHFFDTAEFDFRGKGRPTFFFIDGSHTYDYCRNDSEQCFALCSGRGVFVWHDCDIHHPGVVRLILEWREMGRDIRRITGTSLAYWKSG
jgi:hypothetical protein